MLNVSVIGLGPIGLAAAEAVDADPAMELAGLIDLDPAKAGKTLSDLGGKGGRSKAGVVGKLADAKKADVAIVCTTSHFADLRPLATELIEAGTSVVSSCEEMLWPWYREPALAKQIDEAAKRAGVALLGTGVNPGFVMDYLPVVLSSMVLQVSGVHVVRRLDASKRRKPLQQKVGATMTPEQFAELKKQGKIGHKGMAESVVLVAAGLGRKVPAGAVEESLDPVIADRPIESALGTIQPGQVAGMNNVGRWSGDGLSIELDLTMSVGVGDNRDTIKLSGPVPLELTIPGSTPGDTATVAALVNGARVLPHAQPGLRTMLDLGRIAAARAAG